MIIVSSLQAQTQLKLWTLPPNKVLFNSNPTSSVLNSNNDYNSQIPNYAANSMHDNNGNLLFFIVDNVIYDKDGWEIDYLKISGNSLYLMGGEISIVPKPGSCTKYYIITATNDGTGTAWRPVYAVIDISAQSNQYPTDPTKKGALQSFGTNTNVFDLTSISPANVFGNFGGPFVERYRFGIAVTPYRTATSNYFLYMKGFQQSIYRFVINSTGISFDNTASDGGISVLDPFTNNSDGDGGSNKAYTEMEIVDMANGYYQLGLVYGGRNVVLIKLNTSNGTKIAGTSAFSVTSIDYQIKGLEFSPKGEYVYYAYYDWNVTSNPTHLGYCSLIPSTLTPTEMLSTTYSGANSLGNSFIELGYDNKLYYNTGGSLTSLSINANGSPNVWAPNAVSTVGSFNKTLPDQIDGQVYLNSMPTPVITSSAPNPICYGSAINLCVNYAPGNGVVIDWANSTYNYPSPADNVSCLNGTMPLQNLTYTANVTQNGCRATATYNVVVQPNYTNFGLSSQISNTSSLDYYITATPTITPPAGVGYWWDVAAIDANGQIIGGSEVINASCWWTPGVNVFKGYDWNHTYTSADNHDVSFPCSANVGKFAAGTKYKVTYATWSSTCAWTAKSLVTYQGRGPNSFIVEDAEPDAERVNAAVTAIMNSNSEKNILNVYPNPSNGSFKLECSDRNEKNINIYDVMGRLVFSVEKTTDSVIEINIKDQPKGIYFLNVTSNGTKISKKLIVE